MQVNLAPTKSNLIKLKQELKFARLGHELLDQKRNILVIELLNLIDRAVNAQEEMETILKNAHQELRLGAIKMGKNNITLLGSAINIESRARLKQRKVMGVLLPMVETKFVDRWPYYSPSSTSQHITIAAEFFQKALSLTGKLGELKISIIKLSHEVKKTIRKVNALEKIAIPKLTEDVKYIETRLEENEREMFVLLKMVKKRLEKARQGEEDGQINQPSDGLY